MDNQPIKSNIQLAAIDYIFIAVMLVVMFDHRKDKKNSFTNVNVAIRMGQFVMNIHGI